MKSTALFCTAIACVSSLAMLISPKPAQADPLPPPVIPAGVGVQLKPNNFTIETIDQVHAAGFRVIRRGFYWNAVEKQKGVYDFSDYDAQMEHARKLGMTVVGCLFSHNKLYPGGDKTGFHNEEERKGFAAFAAAAAERYKDYPVLWEIWNEPNVRTFWGQHGTHNTEQFADEYTALVKEVVPAMLKANPDAFVMAGSVSNYWQPSYNWTEYCFQKGILKTGIKAWSVHPYGVKTPEEFAIGHKITRDLLKKYGAPDMPMLNTERGFTITERDEGYSGGSKERALEFQAWHVVRQYMADLMAQVPLTVWYEWGGNEGFGLVENGQARPALEAAKVMIQQLNGYRLSHRVDTGHELDYVLVFKNDKGEQKLVVWTAPPATMEPDKAYPHEVQINLGANASVQVVDLLGNASTATADGGSLRVKVSGAPQYLQIPSNANVSAKSIEPFTPPIADAGAAPEGAVDLKLFEPGTNWKFERNTGEGSFKVTTDASGRQIGVMEYDFSQSKSQGTPYVLASAPMEVAEGAKGVRVLVRSNVAQQLTFRLIDSTGQTLQYKQRIQGTGAWEEIVIPLTRRLERWGGANDGHPHFPIKSIVFSVPLPSQEHKTGKVEYSDAAVVR